MQIQGLLKDPFINTGIDPVVTAWVARAQANGGHPSLNSINAVNNFYGAIKGVISGKMIHLNPIAPDDYPTATTPLIVGPGGHNQWADASGTLAPNQNNLLLGLNGNSGYVPGSLFDTGVIPSNTSLSALNGGISIYVSVQEPDGSNHTHGGCDDYLTGTSTNMYKLIYDFQCVVFTPASPNGTASATSSPQHPGGYAPFSGFISANLEPSGPSWNIGAYGKINGVSAWSTFTNLPINANGGLSAVGSPPSTQSFGWLDANGQFQDPSAETLSFAAFHQGLTSSQAKTLFSAVQIMRQAFGGGYV